MFDLHYSTDGSRVLKWSDRLRYPGERGIWVDVCRDDDKERDFILRVNRQVGNVQVEKDDRNVWRAYILKD